MSTELSSRALYLAFGSGAIDYDCTACGDCCRSMSLVDATPHFSQSLELTSLGAFVEAGSHDQLTTFRVYADGCRFFDDDGRCSLHRRFGAEGKPTSCRLFPFLQLFEVGGLLVLTPHARCPWTAPQSSASVSDHASVLTLLRSWLDQGASITKLDPITPLSAVQRRELEERLRDVQSDINDTADVFLRKHSELQEALFGPVIPAPELDIWLDLLRTAGEPPPLSAHNRRLLLAAVPSLRLLLIESLPLAAIPTALRAFELWLRALAELGPRELYGSDLLHLFVAARGLLHVLTYAAVVPPWDHGVIPPVLEQVRQVVSAPEAMPLGEMLLRFLREDRHGSLCFLAQLGADMPPWAEK